MTSPQLHIAMLEARSEEESRREARRDPLRALREPRQRKSGRAPKLQRVRTARKGSLRASFQG